MNRFYSNNNKIKLNVNKYIKKLNILISIRSNNKFIFLNKKLNLNIIIEKKNKTIILKNIDKFKENYKVIYFKEYNKIIGINIKDKGYLLYDKILNKKLYLKGFDDEDIIIDFLNLIKCLF